MNSYINWRMAIIKESAEILPPNAKLIALYLSTFMNEHHDFAYPSLSRIQTETGLSRPTILKYLQVLIDEDYLIKTTRTTITKGGYKNQNQYTASVPYWLNFEHKI